MSGKPTALTEKGKVMFAKQVQVILCVGLLSVLGVHAEEITDSAGQSSQALYQEILSRDPHEMNTLRKLLADTSARRTDLERQIREEKKRLEDELGHTASELLNRSQGVPGGQEIALEGEAVIELERRRIQRKITLLQAELTNLERLTEQLEKRLARLSGEQHIAAGARPVPVDAEQNPPQRQSLSSPVPAHRTESPADRSGEIHEPVPIRSSEPPSAKVDLQQMAAQSIHSRLRDISRPSLDSFLQELAREDPFHLFPQEE